MRPATSLQPTYTCTARGRSPHHANDFLNSGCVAVLYVCLIDRIKIFSPIHVLVRRVMYVYIVRGT